MSKKEIPASLQPIDQSLPYSPVVQVGDRFYFSGVLPDLDADKKPTTDNITEQTKQIIKKMELLLQKCDLTLNDVYKVTIMLSGSMSGYNEVNQIYAETLKDISIRPSRKTFAVAGLPFGVLIEIEFSAVKQE